MWRRFRAFNETLDYRERYPGHDLFITRTPQNLLWVLFLGDPVEVHPGDTLLLKMPDMPELAHVDILDVEESSEYHSTYALACPSRWNPAAVMANEVNVVMPIAEVAVWERHLWGAVAVSGGEVTVPKYYLDASNPVPPIYLQPMGDAVKISVAVTTISSGPAEQERVHKLETNG